ncbi:MAG TPA: carboxypeptidase regulatory-like domain-containing protein [Thermoanaerobaculia bacterium]|nr:carboxypeptidase regulatory-like domain-containing protein [Thermoanaerobaculia bacterium]
MNKKTRLVLAVTIVTFAFASAMFGADWKADAPLGRMLQRDFPLLGQALRAPGGGSTPAVAAVGGFLAPNFADPYRIESGGARVVLRPQLGNHADAAVSRDQAEYSAVFKNVDALRRSLDGIDTEVLLVQDRQAADAIAYEVVNRSGIAEIAPEGRAVRFVAYAGGRSADLAVSAPLLIDSAGRPSTAARWAVERTAGGGTRIHLKVNDRLLRYPVTVLFTPSDAASAKAITAARTSALGQRSLRPATNQTGSFSGTMTDAATLAPLANEFVYAYDSFGNFVDFTLTDAFGNYSIGGLGTGSYVALGIATGYQTTLYNNIPCPDFSCDVTTGTLIGVVDTVDTPNIKFAMGSTFARILGTVTDTSSAPLANVGVSVYDSTGLAVGYATSDAAGNYNAQMVSGGTFFARTINTPYAGFVDQLYNGIGCSGCNVLTGTPITVAVGAAATGINFALPSNGGRIAGQVTDAGTNAGIAFPTVKIYNSAGVEVTEGTGDISGNYISFAGLTTGSYFVLVTIVGYQPQLFNNVDCPVGCNVTTGTPVSVTQGATTSNINVALHSPDARVSGVVTNANTHALLGGVLVLFSSPSVPIPQGAFTSFIDGSYLIVLPSAGTYTARTQNTLYPGLLDQLYSGIDCSGCATPGTPITVTLGTPVTGINFDLHSGTSTISGTVTDGFTNMPIAAAGVLIYGSSGAFVTAATTDVNGNYTTPQPLAGGTYFVTAFAAGYSGQLYAGLPCGVGCVPTSGTPITVVNGQNTTNINFALAINAARIAGRVTNASDGTPLTGVSVSVYDSGGGFVADGTADGTGAYSVVLPLTGTYFARTFNNTYPGLADQLYNNILCVGCDPTTGTPISASVGSVTTGINFRLTSEACTGTSAPTITPSGPTTFCGSGSVTLTSSSATGNQWFVNGSPIAGETNQTYLASASGNYTVAVTTLGCTTVSDVTTVTINPIPATPTITPAGSTTFCAGDSVTLTSSSDSGNQWFLNGSPIGGATNQTYTAITEGNYTVQVTLLGCASGMSATSTLVLNPPPTVAITGPVTPQLVNTPVNFTATFADNAGDTHTAFWTFDGVPQAGTVNEVAHTVTAIHTFTTLGPHSVTLTVTDSCGQAASASRSVLVYAFATANGSFVIGDGNAAIGTQATFWGAQWSRLNTLSGGAAPDSFKGFANRASTTPPSCGGTWTTDPGNSSNPPDTVPAYLGVFVSSTITKSGSTISGNIQKMVVVKTNPGYAPNPGHAGTGTVLAVICP